MKKVENKLKEKLNNKEFIAKSQCVIRLLMARLEIINMELSVNLKRDVIQSKTGRLKSYKSTCKKLNKKGLERSFSVAAENIHDLIGVRGVCSYVDDIYLVQKMLEEQQDINILKIKDYIKHPKESGYQSLHMILEVPLVFQGETQWIKAELQLRTAAMDYWANLDHQLRYKKEDSQGREAAIDQELKKCAEIVEYLDQTMLEIRKKIEKI
nr:GTP pyrophosphokinase [uncultured Blautia sp.]